MFQWILIGIIVYYFYNKSQNDKIQIKKGNQTRKRKDGQDDDYIDYEEVD